MSLLPFLKLPLSRMLTGQAKINFGQCNSEALADEALLNKVNDNALSKQPDGKAGRGKPAVDINKDAQSSPDEWGGPGEGEEEWGVNAVNDAKCYYCRRKATSPAIARN